MNGTRRQVDHVMQILFRRVGYDSLAGGRTRAGDAEEMVCSFIGLAPRTGQENSSEICTMKKLPFLRDDQLENELTITIVSSRVDE